MLAGWKQPRPSASRRECRLNCDDAGKIHVAIGVRIAGQGHDLAGATHRRILAIKRDYTAKEADPPGFVFGDQLVAEVARGVVEEGAPSD